MATYTENYNLKKPDETDFVDIQDINENMDAIDDAISNLEGKIGAVYCTCSETVQKSSSGLVFVANSINGDFLLEKGAVVNVNFTLPSVPGANYHYLNIDGTGAKDIKTKSGTSLYSYEYKSGNIITFIFDGNYWNEQLPHKAEVGKGRPGIVRLSANYILGASNDSAATTLALNEVYQLANQAIPQSKRGKANGVASLDEGGKVPIEQISFEAFTGYTDSNIAGLYVDFENKIYTRLAGAVGLEAGTDFDKFAMFGGRKRCNVSSSGEITAFYGDENYSDTVNGQVMVYQPKFYYKVVPLKLDKITNGAGYHIRKANYYVSDTKKAGFKLHPAFYDENGNEIEYILYSAYEASLYDIQQKTYFKDGTMTDTDLTLSNYSVCSVAMEKPISGAHKSLTKTNFEKIASQRGKGWHCETIKTLSANQLLMMIELGTMNFQSAIGQGVVSIASVDNHNCSSLTGSTRSLGNTTGNAPWTTNEIGGTQTTYQPSDTGKISITYRGIENPWGNIYKHINGINVWGDETMNGGQLYVADDFDFSETKHDDNYKPVGFTLPNENGYINAMGYGSEKYDWLLMPSEVGGTSALPVGDYVNTTANVNAHKVVMYGGMWSSAYAAGGFTYYCSDGAGTKYKSYGGRIVYIPTAE